MAFKECCVNKHLISNEPAEDIIGLFRANQKSINIRPRESSATYMADLENLEQH